MALVTPVQIFAMGVCYSLFCTDDCLILDVEAIGSILGICVVDGDGEDWNGACGCRHIDDGCSVSGDLENRVNGGGVSGHSI